MPGHKHDHTLPPHDGLRARPATESAAAGDLLGPDHPLTRALESSQTAVEQVVVLLVVEAFAAGLLSHGAAFGWPLLIAAAFVQIVLLARLALARESVQEESRDLIIERCAPLDLASVERERRRLADPRQRDELARSIERLVVQAAAIYRAPNMPLHLAREVEPELREIAALLRGDTTDVVAVALMERLITFAGSALYGFDERKLRDALARIRCRLRAAR
jgi:hypothetical protein